MSNGSNGSELYGVAGFFDDEASLLKAAAQVRDAKPGSFDVFTPYPVHGLDEAQGLKRSKIPYVTFVMGLAGFCIAFGLQYWTSVIDWPLNVGGKPFNSWPAFVPILFELTVLLAGVSTFAALIAICRFPNLKKKAFDPSLTRDRFAIVIEAEEKKEQVYFDEQKAKALLKAAGAKDIVTVAAEGWF